MAELERQAIIVVFHSLVSFVHPVGVLKDKRKKGGGGDCKTEDG